MLIAEGKAAEAAPYLGAWEILGRQVTEDSFTLIDVLVASAIFKDAEQTIPPLYRQIGREAEAERTAARAALIAKPVTDWREQKNLARKQETQTAEQRQDEQLLEERAGVLASMLLPALGQWPAAEEYAPGRMLEYVVFTEFVIAVILGALLLTLFASYLLALRWRVFRPAGEPPPPILMPDLVTLFRILMLGVILPLALFYVVTRFVPGSGHEYSRSVGMHKLAAEFGLLAVALGTLPILMTVGQVQRRCRALGVPIARWQARYLWWSLGSVGGLLLLTAWFLPPTSGQLPKRWLWSGSVSWSPRSPLASCWGSDRVWVGSHSTGCFMARCSAPWSPCSRSPSSCSVSAPDRFCSGRRLVTSNVTP